MRKQGGKRMSTIQIAGKNNVLEFKKKPKIKLSRKARQEFIDRIKPLHLQSDEYQESSVQAMYDDDDDD